MREWSNRYLHVMIPVILVAAVLLGLWWYTDLTAADVEEQTYGSLLESAAERRTALQAKLDGIEVEGAAGGGLVKIRCSAKGRIIGVAIDDSLMQPSEKGILEDLIAAAFNDARAKADEVAGQEMARMQSGMGLPPGFKLPGM